VVNYPDRQTSCSDHTWHVTTFTEGPDGEVPTGFYNFENLQWITDFADLGLWDHALTTIGLGGGGDLQNGIEVSVSSGCDLNPQHCVAFSTPSDPQTVIFPANQTSQSFDWLEIDTGASLTTPGQVDTLDPYLGTQFDGDVPGFSPWSVSDIGNALGNGLATRCDTIITTATGCVDEQYTPTLSLSLKKYGAAADMIQWAQFNLSGAWGLKDTGAPLHRLGDTIVRDNNREIICDKSFVRDSAITAALAPYKDRDSCDEFPFAATYESGAMVDGVNGQPKSFVTTGADCAQVTAVQTDTSGTNEATDWFSTDVIGTPLNTLPCVRGHIPLKLNSGVGGAYGSLIQADRLIDKDPFWVTVTP
jgi:hypothetical protein